MKISLILQIITAACLIILFVLYVISLNSKYSNKDSVKVVDTIGFKQTQTFKDGELVGVGTEYKKPYQPTDKIENEIAYGDSYNTIYDRNGKVIGIQMNGMPVNKKKGEYITNEAPKKRKH